LKLLRWLILILAVLSALWSLFFLWVGPDFEQNLRFSFLEPLLIHRRHGSLLLFAAALLWPLWAGFSTRGRQFMKDAVHSERPRTFALWLFLALLSIYLIHGKVTESKDNYPTRYLGMAILQGDGLNLKNIPAIRNDPRPYYIAKRDNRWVSAYPVFRDLMAAGCSGSGRRF
jgi:hypothetical protein